MESIDFGGLAARVVAGLHEVRSCLIASRDGLTLGVHPAGGEDIARQALSRLDSIGDPERGFLVVGDEVWVLSRRGPYAGIVVAAASAKAGLLLDRLESSLRAAEEARVAAGSAAPVRPETLRRPRTPLHREPRLDPSRTDATEEVLQEVARVVSVSDEAGEASVAAPAPPRPAESPSRPGGVGPPSEPPTSVPEPTPAVSNPEADLLFAPFAPAAPAEVPEPDAAEEPPSQAPLEVAEASEAEVDEVSEADLGARLDAEPVQDHPTPEAGAVTADPEVALEHLGVPTTDDPTVDLPTADVPTMDAPTMDVPTVDISTMDVPLPPPAPADPPAPSRDAMAEVFGALGGAPTPEPASPTDEARAEATPAEDAPTADSPTGIAPTAEAPTDAVSADADLELPSLAEPAGVADVMAGDELDQEPGSDVPNDVPSLQLPVDPAGWAAAPGAEPEPLLPESQRSEASVPGDLEADAPSEAADLDAPPEAPSAEPVPTGQPPRYAPPQSLLGEMQRALGETPVLDKPTSEVKEPEPERRADEEEVDPVALAREFAHLFDEDES